MSKIFILFFPHHHACGILVPQPGIEPVPLAVEAQSLNHWTTREVPMSKILINKIHGWIVIVGIYFIESRDQGSTNSQ